MFSKSNQMWTTHCLLRSTMMSDGAEYGLSVEFNDSKILKGFNTSFLALVGMYGKKNISLFLTSSKQRYDFLSGGKKTTVLVTSEELL